MLSNELWTQKPASRSRDPLNTLFSFLWSILYFNASLIRVLKRFPFVNNQWNWWFIIIVLAASLPSVKLYPYPQASTVVPSNHKVSSPPICRSPLQGLPLSHQPYTPEPHHIVPKVWPFSCQVITCVISFNLQLNQNHNCNHWIRCLVFTGWSCILPCWLSTLCNLSQKIVQHTIA